MLAEIFHFKFNQRMKFSGPLAKPIKIELRRPSLLLSDAKNSANFDEHNRQLHLGALIEQLEKIDLLRAWLGLGERANDPVTDWPVLALSLAQKFVPGFRIKDVSLGKNRGRRKEWNWEKYCNLMADVEFVQRERLRSDSEACLVLVTTVKFKDRWGSFKHKTLCNKLVKARQEQNNIVVMLGNRTKESNGFGDINLLDMLVEIFSITKKQK